MFCSIVFNIMRHYEKNYPVWHCGEPKLHPHPIPPKGSSNYLTSPVLSQNQRLTIHILFHMINLPEFDLSNISRHIHSRSSLIWLFQIGHFPFIFESRAKDRGKKDKDEKELKRDRKSFYSVLINFEKIRKQTFLRATQFLKPYYLVV